MILYRVQAVPVHDPTDWVTQWVPTAEEEQELHRRLHNAPNYTEVRSSKHDIDTGRPTFAQALNLADCNFTIWPGELIRRDGKKVKASS